jgi:hypothetical protein
LLNTDANDRRGTAPVKIIVRVEEGNGASAADVPVEYRWDADTEILSANWGGAGNDGREGMSGSLGIEGADGSWVIVDVADGAIRGVEIAVWPEVRDVVALEPPGQVGEARVVVPSSSSAIASLQMATRVAVDAGPGRRTYHFRVGAPRIGRTIRLARDLLLDVDAQSQISGFWMLNVPPCPGES